MQINESAILSQLQKIVFNQFITSLVLFSKQRFCTSMHKRQACMKKGSETA